MNSVLRSKFVGVSRLNVSRVHGQNRLRKMVVRMARAKRTFFLMSVEVRDIMRKGTLKKESRRKSFSQMGQLKSTLR